MKSGLPGQSNLAWPDIKASGSGQTVNFWMYGGNPSINDWVDTWLAARVKSLYGITIVRNDAAAKGAVKQVATERAQGNNNQGAVDLIWINVS